MKLLKFFTLLPLLLSQMAYAQCQDSTPMLDQMQERYIELLNKDGESILLKVKVADEVGEQAAGFQHICPEQFQTTAILFLFGQAKKPTFHMNNVHANLDIAFIDEKGLIGDIQLMREHIAGQGRLYPSDVLTKYALEVHEGYFKQNNIEPGNSFLKING